MEKLIEQMLSNKGVKSYRSLLLIGVIYVAHKITDIDKRLAVIESRVPTAAVASVKPLQPQKGRAATQ
jgi:hypothetical protein